MNTCNEHKFPCCLTRETNQEIKLQEAKRLLSLAKDKLKNPGRYELLAEEIERFLNK